MKSTILWLAATAGIVIAAQHALAEDNPNLSCITEVVDGKTVRDCGLEVQVVVRSAPEPDPVPGAAAIAHNRDGGPNQDRGDKPRR